MAVGTGGREFQPKEGAFGVLPPDAPREQFVNDPSAIQATPEQVAMARRYEQELQPLTFKDSVQPPSPAVSKPVVAPVLVDPSGQPIQSNVPGSPVANREKGASESGARDSATVPVQLGQGTLRPGGRRDRWAGAVVTAQSAPPQDGVGEVPPVVSPVGDVPAVSAPPVVDLSPSPAPVTPSVDVASRPVVLTESDLAQRGQHPDQPYRPAASDTDSPSRGQPVAVADPNRRITGGFGDVGDAQYFPLDGMEVRELINGLLSQLHERLKDDLRFTIATTYPRCKVKVEVTVEAFGMDHAVVVQAVAPPHTKTPIEIARDHADEIVFVIVAERNEKVSADGDGHSTNQTRRDLGLEVPFKRQVGGMTFDRA